MADELNVPTHRWHVPQNNIALPNDEFSRDWIYADGIAKVDRHIARLAIDPLFANGEPGVALDPNDPTTLFQDTAGTTPVTAPGQSVARVSDKSGGGNHATQPTAGSQPKYALLPANGVRNLANGSASVADVSNWQSGLTINGVTYTKVASGVGTDGLPYADYSAVGTASAVASFSPYVGTNSRAAAAVGQVFTTSFLAQVISGSIPPSQCGVRAEVYGETAPSTFVENSVGTATGPATETLITLTYTLANAASNQSYGNIILRTGIGDTVNYTIRIKALQFERAAARTAYQFNYANTNIAQPPYAQVGALLFDGVDDFMQTPSVDFAGYEQLGSELVTNGDFSSGTTGWTDNSTAPATFTAPSGAGLLTSDGVARARARTSFTTVIGRSYRISYTASASVDYAVGTSPAAGDLAAGAGASLSINFIATTTTTHIQISTVTSGVTSIDNISVKEIIRPADKMTVFAGVRKLSDAARGMVVELGPPAATGFFQLNAPVAASPTLQFASGGTSLQGTSASGFPAPITNVLTGIGDISGDVATLRANGVQVATASADQGTGNFSNAALYIGRRGGASLPFNGYLYQLIVRGAPTTAADITATETWVNSKTGAY